MIISHKNKFIFLKTEKTAGTSIEIALSKYCGPDDIITPISREDEEIRKALGYMGPRNYLAPILDYSARDLVKLLLKRKEKKKFYNHISAIEIIENIGNKVWDSYYKFCFVRNPWDRMISHYYWCCKSEPRPSIIEFIKSDRAMDLKRRGYDLYTINGKIVVDKVCLFENITNELEAVRNHLGIPESLVLPRAKSGYRKDKRSYREILNEKEKAIISKIFSKEINCFGYEF